MLSTRVLGRSGRWSHDFLGWRNDLGLHDLLRRRRFFGRGSGNLATSCQAWEVILLNLEWLLFVAIVAFLIAV